MVQVSTRFPWSALVTFRINSISSFHVTAVCVALSCFPLEYSARYILKKVVSIGNKLFGLSEITDLQFDEKKVPQSRHLVIIYTIFVPNGDRNLIYNFFEWFGSVYCILILPCNRCIFRFSNLLCSSLGFNGTEEPAKSERNPPRLS